MESVQAGDIIAIDHIRDDGYNMELQVNVRLEYFPVPALVLRSSKDIGAFWVYWVHPESKRPFEWHFKYRHLNKAELIE